MAAGESFKSSRTKQRGQMAVADDDCDQPITYRDAGVDIDAGNALVEAIKPAVRQTSRPGADSDLGGFGGLFRPAACRL